MKLRTLCTAIVLVCGCARAADMPTDETFKLCVACHGENGLSVREEVPIVSGAPVEILEDALYEYREGGRECGTLVLMCELATQLSDAQIEEFAAYYADLPFRPAEDPYDKALAAQGEELHQILCVRCHGEPDEIELEAGVLFGQKKGYLRYALKQYADGNREQLPAMRRKTETLSEEQIEALLNYYASYRSEGSDSGR